MFEKYMIVADSAKNITENNKVTGFQFAARLPYYRGLGISMLEEVKVTIDGEEVPEMKIKMVVNGNTYALPDMADKFEERWEMNEAAIVLVEKNGGLNVGEHSLDLLLNLRISYLPFPAIRTASQKITIK